MGQLRDDDASAPPFRTLLVDLETARSPRPPQLRAIIFLPSILHVCAEDQTERLQCATIKPVMIEDRIRNFIAHRGQAAVCDDCIALQLVLRHRQQAQRVTRRLAAAGELQREPGQCSRCGETKLVNHR